MGIKITLKKVLDDRGMTSKELADRIGTTTVNLSRIKTGSIRGMRFGTLYAICKVLHCQPGDVLSCEFDEEDDEPYPDCSDMRV